MLNPVSLLTALRQKVPEDRRWLPVAIWDFLCLEGELEKEVGPIWAQCQLRDVSKAKSDKTPSFVGLNGLFYEKYALLWQKGRIRHLVCFLLLAHWPVEGG